MKKQNKKTLSLSQETVRTLRADLQRIAGGVASNHATCYSNLTCGGPCDGGGASGGVVC